MYLDFTLYYPLAYKIAVVKALFNRVNKIWFPDQRYKIPYVCCVFKCTIERLKQTLDLIYINVQVILTSAHGLFIKPGELCEKVTVYFPGEDAQVATSANKQLWVCPEYNTSDYIN